MNFLAICQSILYIKGKESFKRVLHEGVTCSSMCLKLDVLICFIHCRASVLEELISTYKDSNYLLDVNLRAG